LNLIWLDLNACMHVCVCVEQCSKAATDQSVSELPQTVNYGVYITTTEPTTEPCDDTPVAEQSLVLQNCKFFITVQIKRTGGSLELVNLYHNCSDVQDALSEYVSLHDDIEELSIRQCGNFTGFQALAVASDNICEPQPCTRKRVIRPEKWKRNRSKLLRQSGKAYIDARGKIRRARYAKVDATIVTRTRSTLVFRSFVTVKKVCILSSGPWKIKTNLISLPVQQDATERSGQGSWLGHHLHASFPLNFSSTEERRKFPCAEIFISELWISVQSALNTTTNTGLIRQLVLLCHFVTATMSRNASHQMHVKLHVII